MTSPKPSTLRVGRRYRANRLDGPYEAIVIGSGIGGLTTAACLSRMGRKVAVFEQHYTAGGFTHSYDRNGYEWDVGVHYIGDMGSDHTLGKRLFDHITDGKLKWAAMDPDFARRYPGRATIEIIAPGPFEWYEAWADKPWGKRGDDYEAMKEAYAQRLLEKLYQKLPHLRGKVDYYELSTPLSTNYFCRYQSGEIYGLDHTPERFEQDWLKPKTRIPGLYLTGQDVMTCGVVGAMIGGLLTTLAITGLRGMPLAKRIFVG